MAQVKISNRFIGQENIPFIVAEAGINHNGDINVAYKMIEIAKQCGADAVKFQTFKADEFVADPDLMFTYKSQGKEITESMLKMFKRYEFSRDEWVSVKKKCAEEEIIFFSTPQNRSDLDLLLEIGIPAIKIGSDDFVNLPLLKSCAETGIPLIVSCGMSDLAEVYQALDIIGTLDGYPTILLLCTSQYPTPPQDVNIRKISTLRNIFKNIVIGFSDHTRGSMASSLAVALGACFFEKHFTLDNNLPGPDHWFSENPESLYDYVKNIKMAYMMLGSDIVRPTAEEYRIRKLARRSIVTLTNINQGDVLTDKDIGLKRTGYGLPASLFTHLIGLKATRRLKKGELITWGDFS